MKYAPIDAFAGMCGLGRSTIYLLLGEGKLHAVKIGKRTLIDVDAGLAWIGSQPAATIRCSRKAA